MFKILFGLPEHFGRIIVVAFLYQEISYGLPIPGMVDVPLDPHVVHVEKAVC